MKGITEILALVPWWAASLIANVCITRIEYLNRTLQLDRFSEVLPHTGLLILIAQWGLWNAWTGAPSMMIAWVWFTAMNNLMRLASAQWAVGEPPGLLTTVGSALMFLAAWLVKEGSVVSS
jgi:hypothetical protein